MEGGTTDMSTGIITDICRCSTVDGPGIRTTVFFKGCPLRCIWCHNPETWSGRIEEGYEQTVSVEDVVAECLKDRAYYRTSGGGVTLSGGEPLVQSDFLFDLCHRLRDEGVHTALDTSGCSTVALIEQSLELIDLYLFDYKATDPEIHLALTGESPKVILENLDFLISRKAGVILRCPIIPGVNDDIRHLRAIAQMERRYPELLGIELLPWHTMGISKCTGLGMPPDPRLPRQNTSADLIQFYREYFKREACLKVRVIDATDVANVY